MNLLAKKVFRSESFFVTAVLSIILLINFFPYWYGNFIETSDVVFLGEHYNITDTASYYTKMLQGKEHGLLIYDQYTTEPQKPTFIFSFYAVLGIISRLFSISIPTLFFMSRVFFGVALYILVYFLIKYFFSNVFWRRVAFIFICFSSGFGWVYAVCIKSLFAGINIPVDLWLPDAVPAERLLSVPHVSAAHILLVLTLIFFIKLYKTHYTRYIFSASSTVFLLSILLPFETIVLILSLVILWLIYLITRMEHRFKLIALISIVVLSSPPLIYMIYLSQKNPIWSKMQIQNFVPSPPVIYYVIGYGLLLLLGCWGLFLALRKRDERFFVLCSWALAVMLLAYFPIPIQRRFVETAFYIPLTILAVYALKNFFNARSEQFIYRTLIILFMLSSFSNIIVLRNTIFFLNRGPLPYYVPRTDISALDWLSQNSKSDSIILSSFISGNITTFFAHRRVYVGHWTETLNLTEKLDQVNSFFSGDMNSETAKTFLRTSNINYVLYLKMEQYQKYNDPGEYSFLEKIYEYDNSIIYKVVN